LGVHEDEATAAHPPQHCFRHHARTRAQIEHASALRQRQAGNEAVELQQPTSERVLEYESKLRGTAL
jgi:hypothetical protein